MTTPNEARPEWEPVGTVKRLSTFRRGCELTAVGEMVVPFGGSLYGPAVHTEMLRAQEESRVLREALEALVAEYCDYMLLNKLGNPETQHNIMRSRAALKGTP